MENIDFIDTGVRKDFERDVQDNPHVQYLWKAYTDQKQSVEHLLEYGLDKVQKNREDQQLAAYFFYISELPEIDSEISSYALDVSEYLRGMFDEDAGYNAFDPQRAYIKIKPLLRNS